MDNPSEMPVKESLNCIAFFQNPPLSSQTVSKTLTAKPNQGYAHAKRPFTRYSGCWVLASAVAFLAIVVVILPIVVILLATVVTDTL